MQLAAAEENRDAARSALRRVVERCRCWWSPDHRGDCPAGGGCERCRLARDVDAAISGGGPVPLPAVDVRAELCQAQILLDVVRGERNELQRCLAGSEDALRATRVLLDKTDEAFYATRATLKRCVERWGNQPHHRDDCPEDGGCADCQLAREVEAVLGAEGAGAREVEAVLGAEGAGAKAEGKEGGR